MRFLLITLFLPSFCLAHSSFYPNSYEESRQEFKRVGAIAKTKNPNIELNQIAVPTNTNKNLFIDYLYAPQSSNTLAPQRLLIITAGVHGVEAYTGAAIEIDFIQKFLNEDLLRNSGVLIVHAINPYGFFFNRRVTENNVDLNRNFSTDEMLFQTKNEAYEKFSPFLNPQEKIKTTFINDCFLFFKSIMKLMEYGKKQMTQAAIGGQYQQPVGIYFGGNKREPNISIIEKLFKEKGMPYSRILHIDLHTGYGETGRLHFFSSQEASQKNEFKNLFDGFPIDIGSDEDFYKTSGSFDQFSSHLFKNKIVIPMTFEFGTMDSQTIFGGFLSLKNMIYENQGFQYGYADETSEIKVKRNFIDMFSPADDNWRTKVFNKSNETFLVLIDRFIKI